jgi:hypothetical protein
VALLWSSLSVSEHQTMQFKALSCTFELLRLEVVDWPYRRAALIRNKAKAFRDPRLRRSIKRLIKRSVKRLIKRSWDLLRDGLRDPGIY